MSYEDIINTINSSTMFDPIWYLSVYKDVSDSGIDPVEHFLLYGAALQRDPSPFFCTTTYLQMYSDVLQSGINPLYHYLQYGIAEGREVSPSSLDHNTTISSYHDRKFSAHRNTSSNNIPGASEDILGSLESISDGDVLFFENIKIKGWIDTSLKGFSHLVIVANDVEYIVKPDIVRADVNLKYNNFSIFGYDFYISMPNAGPKINISIKILLKDETIIDWKRLQIWLPSESDQNHYILKGHAYIFNKNKNYFISGRFPANLKTNSYVSVYQDGNNICNISQPLIASNTTSFEEVIINYNPSFMSHLFFINDGVEYYWMSIDAIHSDLNNCIKITHPENGSCIKESAITIIGTAESERLTVTINGAKKIRLKAENDMFSTTQIVTENLNKIIVEVSDDKNNYTKSIYWRHPTNLPVTKNRFFAALPASGISPPKKNIDAIKSVLLLRKNASPTDEIYICNPLEKMESTHNIQFKVIDTDSSYFKVDEITSTLMQSTHIVVSRYLASDWLAAISRLKDKLGPIVYIMDDDLLAAEETESLPKKYREKMSLVALGEFRSVYNICDKFIVTSRYLQDKYQSEKLILMQPECIYLPIKVTEYNPASEIIVSYHGTDSHKDDLEFIASALRFIHDKFSNVRIRIIMRNDHVPPVLSGLQRVDIIKPMPWLDYKQYRKNLSEHICLAPLLATPYNQAKSNIKFHDTCSVGAVGVYTNSDTYSNIVVHQHNGLLVDNDPIAWKNALVWLLKNPDIASRMAKNARENALELTEKNESIKIWEKILY